MKDKKLEDLLNVLDDTKELRQHDAPMDDFASFIRELDVQPGKYKIPYNLLLDKYKDDKNVNQRENIRNTLTAMGFIHTPHHISVSKKDKERLTLEYAQKISEKVYKGD